MKRTSLVLNEELLLEALAWSGERTFSAAVNRALEQFVKQARARQILDLAGSGSWQGNLSEVRRDPPRRPSRKRRGSR